MNPNITIKQLLGIVGIMWAIGFFVSAFLSPSAVFHVINPFMISLGVVLITVFGKGAIDSLRQEGENITPGHLLTIGITVNLIGTIIRIGRWYVTGEHPAVWGDIDFWFYNTGIWLSIWAGFFLLGAAKLAVKSFRLGTLMVIFFSVFGFLMYINQYIHLTG